MPVCIWVHRVLIHPNIRPNTRASTFRFVFGCIVFRYVLIHDLILEPLYSGSYSGILCSDTSWYYLIHNLIPQDSEVLESLGVFWCVSFSCTYISNISYLNIRHTPVNILYYNILFMNFV